MRMDTETANLLTRADAAICDTKRLREQVRGNLKQTRKHLAAIATTIQNDRTGRCRSWRNWNLGD
ncbi:hypothetical protein [Microvirga sesbaniae]|uniref:hypothetical protein n=1 Tax=Microvirga sesbaniae TaxID=681392 RepID=UPI0021C61B19|nr:hypothetical protein [Microvirga sp. HBU67692]